MARPYPIITVNEKAARSLQPQQAFVPGKGYGIRMPGVGVDLHRDRPRRMQRRGGSRR